MYEAFIVPLNGFNHYYAEYYRRGYIRIGEVFTYKF